MIRKYCSVVVFSGAMLSNVFFSAPALARTIYGIENAGQFHRASAGEFYIQAGSFLNKRRANQYQLFLQSKTTFPVKTIHNSHYYRVIIGPIGSSQEVRRVAASMSSPMKTWPVAITPHQIPSSNIAKKNNIKQRNIKENKLKKHRNNPVAAPLIPIADRVGTNTSWFVSLGGGVQYPQLNSNIAVNNNSDFPSPYNQDLYSTSNTSEPIIGVMAGRRWERDSRWLPAYSLGIYYQYFFTANAGGTVMQYSLPEFTNYSYKWNLSSNLVLASAKLNVFQYANKISPFINGGIGGAFNNASGYSEVALPGVTPRESPGFTNNRTSQFAYALGAGIDYKIMQQLIVSVGYNFQDLGRFSSGQGEQTWSGQSLNLGTYQSNDVFASVSYLFEK